MRYSTLFFLFTFFSTLLFGQDQKAIDSLTRALNTAKDTDRVIIFDALSDKYHFDDPKLGMKYAMDAIQLSEKLQYGNGLFHGNMSMGLALYGIGELDSALYYFEIAKAQAEQNKNLGQMASIYSNMGNVYGDMGQNKKCLQYYFVAADYTEQLHLRDKKAYILVNIATVYSVLGQHDSALVFYLDAEKILSGIDRNQEKLPIVYNNIGATYLELHDTAKAQTAFENAYRISKLHNDQRGLASAYDHLGVMLFYSGLHDSAYALLKKAVSIYEITDSKSGISEACVHLGEVYTKAKNYDSALVYLNKGLKVAEELQDFFNLKIYYTVLSELYETKGDLGKALDYHKKLMMVKDTVFNLNNSNIVAEMKTQLANEKNQREIELLHARDQKKTVIIYAGVVVVILVLLLGILAFNRYLVKKRSSELLSEQNEEIQHQKNIIEEKNKDITDSIRYAQRIQNAILPSREQMQAIFPQSFVLFRPKDIVSGDFYWFEKSGDYKLFSVVDCTGHGVPGAMLSVVGHNLLNKALHDDKLVMPDKLLHYLNQHISQMLRQKQSDQAIQDGMDIAVCSYHEPTQTLYYAGSFNSLYLVRNGVLKEIKSDKIFIGNYNQAPDKTFTLHSFQVEKNDLFYVFSDGFADQFGGPTGKKFKYRPFQQLLAGMYNDPMEMQEKKLAGAFEEWKRNLDQVDDVCVIGVRI
jgi:serine phosphatase RsbU (regulator of sigma subunit)